MGCLLSSSMLGLKATSSKKAYAACCVMHVCCRPCPFPHVRPPMPPRETLKLLKACLAQFLWGLWVLVHTRFCLSHLSISGGYGFDSKCDFAPPTILLGYLLCPWKWSIFFFLVRSNILLTMVVHQWVAILECLQKMSSRPSTPPSCLFYKV